MDTPRVRSIIMSRMEVRRWFSQLNKEIICQHISLYSRMVLLEEKNLTRAYPIRQFPFIYICEMWCIPTTVNFSVWVIVLSFKHIFLIWYKLHSPENVWRHTGINPVTLVSAHSPPCCVTSSLYISPKLHFNQMLVFLYPNNLIVDQC